MTRTHNITVIFLLGIAMLLFMANNFEASSEREWWALMLASKAAAAFFGIVAHLLAAKWSDSDSSLSGFAASLTAYGRSLIRLYRRLYN